MCELIWTQFCSSLYIFSNFLNNLQIVSIKRNIIIFKICKQLMIYNLKCYTNYGIIKEIYKERLLLLPAVLQV